MYTVKYEGYILLFRVRASRKTNFIGALSAHQMKITLIIPVTQGFCPVEHGALHLKGIIVHHAQILRDFLALLLPRELTYAALFMRDVIFILTGYVFKIIKPIHRVITNMVPGSFGLFGSIGNFFFRKSAFTTLGFYHQRTVGSRAYQPREGLAVKLSFRLFV